MFKKISFMLGFLTPLSHALSNDWMNTNIPPQKDFYVYSNGGWIKNNPIPDDYGRWSIFDTLEMKNQNELIQIIQSIPQNKRLASHSLYQKIFQYYQSGMNTQQIEEVKIEPLMPYILAIQQYHHPHQLSALLAKLHQIGVHAFFELGPMNDIHHPKEMIAGISQDGLNLPHRDYYLKTDEQSLQIQKKYIEFLQSIFMELYDSEKESHLAAIDTFNIEKQLALISHPTEYFRQPKNIDHSSSSKVFNQLYPFLDFKHYMISRELPKYFVINNCTPDYLEKLQAYLKTLSPKAIQHYLLAHLIFQYAGNLHHQLSEKYCQLDMRLTGSKRCPKREIMITKELNTYLGFAIGELYVATHLKKGTIEKTQKMVEEIKKELLKHLQNSWMSNTTKLEALKKINHMKSRVGYHTFEINYQTLDVKPQNYVQNAIAIVSFETQRQILKIGQLVNEAEWDMAPQSINAYYDLSQNQINIPLGILQKPFFDIHASDAENYGGIGAVIGHEMSHGFDDQGSQFNEKGQFKSWWQTKDLKNFKNKVQCIVQQYSEYTVQGYPQYHINGKLVSGEAIADLIGLKLALQAYLNQSQKRSSMPSFFINYAHIWAANIRDEEALKRSLTDPHPPMNLRVNATMRNMPEFYQAFHLSPPKHKTCSIF